MGKDTKEIIKQFLTDYKVHIISFVVGLITGAVLL